jgi:hypothetical protein
MSVSPIPSPKKTVELCDSRVKMRWDRGKRRPRGTTQSVFIALSSFCNAFEIKKMGTDQSPGIRLYSFNFGPGVSFLGRNCMSILCFAAPTRMPRGPKCKAVWSVPKNEPLEYLFALYFYFLNKKMQPDCMSSGAHPHSVAIRFPKHTAYLLSSQLSE